MPDRQIPCEVDPVHGVAFVRSYGDHLCIECYKRVRADDEEITVEELEQRWADGENKGR